jgi:hypothetical protein
MYVTSQKELAPEEDQGILFNIVKAPQAANLDYLEQATQELHKVFETVPEKEHVFIINGLGNNVHQAIAGILFKPWEERKRTQKQILQSLQPKGGRHRRRPGDLLRAALAAGSTGGPPVQFVITTTADYFQLAQVLAEVQAEATKSGLFIFTDSDLKFETPQVELKLDHDKANRLGITMSDIGGSLATLLGGNYVNRFNLYGRSYQVIPQVPRDFRLTSDWLRRYQVRTTAGALVPLSSIATVEQSIQPNALTSFQQLNSATLSGVPFPGRTVGEAIDFLKATARQKLPEGFSYDFQGESRQYVQEGSTLVITFAFALIIIYLVLAAQYESFRDPLIILIALPTAMFGALIPLNLGLATVNIYTQVGLVTLIGLISKHGILMVDYANHLQENEGLDRRAAIEKAAAIRLRPILMTTAAMVVGMVPLLTASGAGAASRYSIGLVIAAGMTVGTLFTLFVTPAVYTYVAREHRAHGPRRSPRWPPATDRNSAGAQLFSFAATRPMVCASGLWLGQVVAANAHFAPGRPASAPQDRLRADPLHLRGHAFSQHRGRARRSADHARGAGVAAARHPLAPRHVRAAAGAGHARHAGALQAGQPVDAAAAGVGAVPDRARAAHSFLLFPHIINTRIAHVFFGVEDNYLYELARLWPENAILQSTLLLLVWVHGCLGLHFWLRLYTPYRAAAPVLLFVAIAVPLAALGGFMVSGRAVALSIENPQMLAKVKELTNWPNASDGAILAWYRTSVRLGFAGVLLTIALIMGWRYYALSRRPKIAIKYTGGPVVKVPHGPTLLEISRMHNIPHASVCGGAPAARPAGCASMRARAR